MTAAIPCVKSVATAAPATPEAGITPYPLIKSGSRIKFKRTVHPTIYIGIFTCPIPRMIDWNIANAKTKTKPKNDTRIKVSASW